MDFSSWKKKCEDGKTCTLVHPKGHTMTIALKALPSIQREQIKRLKFEEGGKVPVPPTQDTSPTDKQTRATQMAQGAQQSGGMPDTDTIVNRLKNAWADGGEVRNYDEGSTETVQPSDDSQDPKPGNHTPITINVGVPTGQNMSTGPATEPQKVVSQNIEPAQKQNMILPDQTLNAPAAVQQQQEAIKEQAPIEAAKAQAAAQNEGEYIDKIKTIQQARANAYNEFKGHTDDFNAYIQNNPINPKAYQENQNTGAKMATGIGLFLGGFSTPFGGHNYAQDFLNKQIERNIEGQKARADQQKTVWGAYKDLYGDSNIATNLATVSANDMLVHQTNLASAQQGTAQAAAAAKAMQAQKALENQQLLFNAAKIRGALPSVGSPSMGTSSPSGGGNPARSEGPQARRKPTDPNWNDGKAKPWTDNVPKANPPQQFGVDYDKIKRSQMLGQEGVPGQILPGEVGDVNNAAGMAESANQAIKEIHKQFPEMWKNASVGNDAVKYIGSQHLWGMHLPDVTDWTTEGKRYMTAASTVKKQLANVIAGGGSEEVYRMIESQLPANTDSPSDYRQKLENVENVIRQQVYKNGAVLKKYNLLKDK